MAGTTYTGTEGDDIIRQPDDTILGLGGDDFITAGAAFGVDQTLDGGSGADHLFGRAGSADIFLVDNANDQVQDTFDYDGDTVIAQVNYGLNAHIENLVLQGSATVGIGNALDNTITGNTGTGSTLDGGAGDDKLIGGTGGDTYILDSYGDAVVETDTSATDIDTVVSSTITLNLTLGGFENIENATLLGNSQLDATGNALNNVLIGNSGVNTLTGNDGDDTLDGKIGADTMIGGDGNDTYFVDSLQDKVIDGGSGNTDEIDVSFSYNLGDGTHDDIEVLRMLGTANINGTTNNFGGVIYGNSGNNVLTGGDGNDALFSGGGLDTMIGGNGNDLYEVRDTRDVILESSNGGTADQVIAYANYTLGANLEQLYLGGTANINATGNMDNNRLVGNAGNNTLDGGLGADTMSGGDGNDTYIVDNAGDIVDEITNQGNDTILSSIDYNLSVSALEVENLTLTGTAAHNAIGNSYVNILTGNAAANFLNGLEGADTMIGGGGNDTYQVDDVGDVVSEAAGQGIDSVISSVSYTLSANVENLTLTGAPDLNGTGNALVNTILGNSGANTLDGGGGADTLIGGDGDDVYIVDSSADVIIEGSGAGTGNDTVQASISFSLGTNALNVENLFLLGTANINGTGDGNANVITGNSGNNTLSGGDGNDTLDGGGGIDRLVGGLGDDTFIVDSSTDVIVEGVNQGIDLVISNATSYTLSSNIENVQLGLTAISVTGNAIDNTLTGNNLDNTLDGGAGADSLVGGDGNDTYYVDNAGDVVVEAANQGTDTVYTSLENYTLGANVENLVLMAGTIKIGHGNTLDNVITGNSSNNTLYGDAGNDTIDGGGGVDTMYGNAGDDTFIVDNAGDLVIEVANEGNADTIRSSVSYTLPAEVEYLVLTGTANINGTGTAVASQTIEGNTGNNTLDGGGGGNDTMIGHDGNDTYVVHQSNDVIIENAGEGTDSILSGISYDMSAQAANVENLTVTSAAGNIVIVGNASDNIITDNATATDNTLDGGAGNDTLIGGVGDTLIGGSGNDYFIVTSATTQVSEDVNGGNDTLEIRADGYTLNTANIENIIIGSAVSTIYGSTGDDTITGNTNNNTLAGGDGNDILAGMAGNDSLDGGNGDDSLNGGIGNDILTGGIGNDTLDGGVGTDTMTGGVGDDTYFVDSTSDVIHENANEGIDTVFSSVTYTLSGNIENLVLTGTAAINGTGDAGANTIIGNAAANIISGGGGDDTIDGGLGADRMSGGQGDDLFIVDNIKDTVSENAGEGTDTVQSSVSFTLGANIENLELTGSNNINGTGNTLVNTITGNSGDNTLDGGTGADTLIGGLGNDTYVFDNLNDKIIELSGEGNDTIRAAVGNVVGNPALFDLSLAGYENIENLVLTGTTVLNATGNDNNNTFTGNAGINHFAGGLGDDVYIINSNDLVTEAPGGGIDTVIVTLVGSSPYVIPDNVENVILAGTTATNLTGNSGDNTLGGSAGNNTLDGGAGADTLSGGLGNDVYIVDNVGDLVIEGVAGGKDLVKSSISYTLTANVESLTLTGTANIDGTGNDLDNTITGNAGNNTLDGGIGADHLFGGAGNDVYIIDSKADVIVDTAGIDTVISTVSYVLQPSLENLTLSGSGDINGTGSAYANIIIGNSGANTIDGMSGNDTISGGDGNDVLKGNIGNDIVDGGLGDNSLDGGAGNDILTASTGNDTITGGDGNDTIDGGDGANVLSGGTGNDTITGGAGNDTIDGGTGIDTMTGGAGNDIYTVDHPNDVIIETAGNGTDTLNVNTSSYTLSAATEIEVINMGAQSSILDAHLTSNGATITGSALANQIHGGSGDDIINGGLSSDLLWGGAGADTFVINSSDALTRRDTIEDFNAGEGDKLDISNLLTGYQAGTSEITDFVHMVTSGNSTLVEVNTTGDGVASHYHVVATLVGVTGLEDEAAAVINGTLIV